MTPRERWTVYPLLFLTLMLSARDKLMPPITTRLNNVECRELTIVNSRREPLVVLGESLHRSGLFIVYGPKLDRSDPAGESPLDREDTDGRTDESDGGEPGSNRGQFAAVEVTAEESGGVLRVRADGDYPTLQLGHDRRHRLSGLMGIDSRKDPIRANKTLRNNFWGTLVTWDDFEEPEPPSAGTGDRETARKPKKTEE